jgi:Nif-specific regulatory protein
MTILHEKQQSMSKTDSLKEEGSPRPKKPDHERPAVNGTLNHACTEPCQILSVLHEITATLNPSENLEETLVPVLEQMARYLRLERGTLTLFHRDQGEILIELAYGLSPEQQGKGKYRIGEGITGKVAASGQSVVVPRICDEPDFLNRTLSRNSLENLAFLCVPVVRQGQVVGTLAADRRTDSTTDLQKDVFLLEIIAFMIAETVAIHLLQRERLGEEGLRLQEENKRLRAELAGRFQPPNLVGNSSAMRQIYDLIARVAPSSTTVLILGESGVGKELVSQAIHYSSPRRDGPFIKFNCAALPESMVESELFGHEKGAFTGAINARKGRFESADHGTVFLDEVGELSPSVQAKLLRVLQEREIERLGSGRPVKVDVRILAATNRDLDNLTREGRFREDLFYRLNVFPIVVPPLRSRKVDIPSLVDHLVDRFAHEHHKKAVRVSTPAIDMLMQYHWPGNVRELANCVERAVLLSEDGVIRSYHLPPTLQTATTSDTSFQGSLEQALHSLEKEFIIDALKAERGNSAAAARRLKLTERVFGLRLKKHRIDPRRFKNADA